MKVKWRNILVVLGLIIAVFLLIDFNRRLEELNRLNRKIEAVRAEGTNIMETQVALLTKVAVATSDSGVEPWAYENKWVREGEHPIVLMPAGSVTATQVPMVVTQTQSPPNWRIWWELFFGAN